MSWYRIDRNGATLHVHAQPGAKRTEVVGLHGDCIKLRLASPPVDGKANACLVEYLAQRLGVARGQVTIIRGASSRRKTVAVTGTTVQPSILLEPETKRV